MRYSVQYRFTPMHQCTQSGMPIVIPHRGLLATGRTSSVHNLTCGVRRLKLGLAGTFTVPGWPGHRSRKAAGGFASCVVRRGISLFTWAFRLNSRMAILVVCQTCKTRFQVSEKFAGKQGPCPKCKAVITIPKVEEQVVIHAPEEYAGGAAVAAKDAQGRSVLKPIARDKTRFQPVVFAAAAAGILVALVVAFLLRDATVLQDSTSSILLLSMGAVLLAPPIVLAGYVALRDAESEPYRGLALWIRVGIVSIVYAGLWGIAAIFGVFVFAGAPPELWQLIPPTAIMIVGGTVASMATLDLEPGNGFFHYAFYLAATVFLRVVMGLPPLGGQAADTSPRPGAVASYDAAEPQFRTNMHQRLRALDLANTTAVNGRRFEVSIAPSCHSPATGV